MATLTARHSGARAWIVHLGGITMVSVLLTLTAHLVPAEPAVPSEDPGSGPVAEDSSGKPGVRQPDTIYSLLVKGGFLVVPIALCSVIVLTLAIERTISLRQARTVPPDLLESIYDIVPEVAPEPEHQEAAADLTRRSRSLAGNVLEVGVMRLHRDPGSTEAFLEEATQKEAHRLERKLRPFAVIAQVAPLLGLLGTVYGMITCFGEAAAADAASRAETLAQGIYRALVTTAAGLTVAIPSLVLLHTFQGRVDRVVDQLEEVATDFLDHYYGEEVRAREPLEPFEPATRGEGI